MDLKAITKILDTQESLFRTILDSSKSTIDGDALKAKLTLHHINLVIIAGNRYPQSASTISDPFDSSSSTSNSTTKKQKRGRGRPPKVNHAYRSSTPDQVLATPKGRSMAYSRDMRPAGASRLFKGRKGVAVPVIDFVEDDDSAGSPVEDSGSESESIFISPNSNSSKPSTRKSRRFSWRTGKEAERKRSSGEEGLGLGMSGMSERKETVEERGEAEINAAGFEGGKDSADNDREMEELIQYTNDEDEGESPSKKRRSL